MLPQYEHKFDSKTMELGKQERLSDIPKIGDLRDVRSGGEFEEYLTTLFQALGYHAENTKISGDQGVDVLVCKNGKKYGIQAKYYSQPVGNFAVQEILAGREYFKLSKGIVVTNATYTASAKDLAEKTQIRLIDGDELQQIIRLAKAGKHWYDPCNSAIELGIVRGKWNVDMEKKNKCLVKNVFLRANHPACKDYEHKL